MQLWEEYTSNPTTALENELVKKYTPLVYKVCGKHFNKLNFDDCFSYGLEAVMLAIRKWVKIGRVEQPEHEFIKFAYGAIWWRINDKMVRTFKTQKSQQIRTNVESFEHIVGECDELESHEEKMQRVKGHLEQVFKAHREKTYTMLLKHYGEDIPWTELWQEAGYSDASSMRESMNQIMDKLQDKAQFLVS